MKYNLVSKKTSEVIHTIDLSNENGISEARIHFIGSKKLDEKEFDKLWEVNYHKTPKNPNSVKGYKRVKLGIYEDLGDGHMILVEDLVNQLSEEIVPDDSDYIYESLDGGKTVFKRKKGSNKRELVKDWEKKKQGGMVE